MFDLHSYTTCTLRDGTYLPTLLKIKVCEKLHKFSYDTSSQFSIIKRSIYDDLPNNHLFMELHSVVLELKDQSLFLAALFI